MDLKMPKFIQKNWIVPILCFAAVLALGVTVFALTVPEEEQMASVSNGSAPSAYLEEPLPSTNATQTTIPADTTPPVQPPMPPASGATVQPSVSLPPQPAVLELNTMTRKNFGKSNGYITCKTEEYWLGIDVSLWQEDIDWEQVAAAGFKFVMVRVAYRGWSKAGELHIDTKAQENLEGAAAAGLKVGVYIYSQATNVSEAVEEAQFVLQLLDGRHLDMPVVFDWEVPNKAGARTRYVKAKTMQACALAFCEEIKAEGYQPMVYFNQWQGSYQYNLAQFREAGIELWLAMYTRAMTYTYKVQMWQYTGKGKVPGIQTKVDIDIYFPNH